MPSKYCYKCKKTLNVKKFLLKKDGTYCALCWNCLKQSRGAEATRRHQENVNATNCRQSNSKYLSSPSDGRSDD